MIRLLKKKRGNEKLHAPVRCSLVLGFMSVVGFNLQINLQIGKTSPIESNSTLQKRLQQQLQSTCQCIGLVKHVKFIGKISILSAMWTPTTKNTFNQQQFIIYQGSWWRSLSASVVIANDGVCFRDRSFNCFRFTKFNALCGISLSRDSPGKRWDLKRNERNSWSQVRSIHW